MRLFKFCTVIFLCLFLCGCNKISNDIDGVWQRFDTCITFKNGKAFIANKCYNFYTDNGILYLNKDGVSVAVPYNIGHKILCINGSDFHSVFL